MKTYILNKIDMWRKRYSLWRIERQITQISKRSKSREEWLEKLELAERLRSGK